MKRISLTFIYMFTGMLIAFAQGQAGISCTEDTHDFGKIPEEIGTAVCEFTIKNTGDAPLILNKVTASCGCTTPEWTREPIEAGKTGQIVVSYGAKGRPGPFNKSITVNSNAKEGALVLKIKGDVIPEAKDPAAVYTKQIGNLKLKATNMYFNAVKNTDTPTSNLDVYNPTDQALKVSFSNVPKGMKVVAQPETIAPKANGIIAVTVFGEDAKGYGAQNYSFNVLVNGKAVNDNKIGVSSIIVGDYSKLTPEQKNNAPVIALNTMSLNFGSIASKEASQPQTLKITNKGKSDLNIQSIKAENTLFSISGNVKTIKPGETADIKITLSSKVQGDINAALNIVSNDPNNPLKVVRLIVKK